MRRLLTIALSLLLVASPTSARTDEAEYLEAAMTHASEIAGLLNAGTLTLDESLQQATLLRDSIDPATVSTACLPLAVYAWASTDAFVQALTMLAAQDMPSAQGYAMVLSALFLYPAHETSRYPGVVAGCASGL